MSNVAELVVFVNYCSINLILRNMASKLVQSLVTHNKHKLRVCVCNFVVTSGRRAWPSAWPSDVTDGLKIKTLWKFKKMNLCRQSILYLTSLLHNSNNIRLCLGTKWLFLVIFTWLVKILNLYKWALLVSSRSIGQVQSTKFVVVFLLCTVAAPALTACYLMNHLHFIYW